jgi:hypothetical protein
MTQKLSQLMPDSEDKFLVDQFIARGGMYNILSKAGTGKTYLTLEMGIAVASGQKFMGMDTTKATVLFVDQDEPSKVTKKRLYQICTYRHIDFSDIENFHISMMDGFLLKDGSLKKEIKRLKADLTIIDTLSAVSLGLDMSKAKDMSVLRDLYQECITPENTIVFNHHISEHKAFSFSDFLTSDPGDLAMYSSIFTQIVDGYYILYNPNKGKDLDELFIRPVITRLSGMTGIKKTGMFNTDEAIHFNNLEDTEFSKSSAMTKDEFSIMALFLENPVKDQTFFVKDIMNSIKDNWKDNKVRSIVDKLEDKGFLFHHVLGNNKFSYQLTEMGTIVGKQQYKIMVEEEENHSGKKEEPINDDIVTIGKM